MIVCYFLLGMRGFNMHEKNAICFAKPLIFNSITVILIKIEDVRIKLAKISNRHHKTCHIN